jgi:hypothetical protein
MCRLKWGNGEGIGNGIDLEQDCTDERIDRIYSLLPS